VPYNHIELGSGATSWILAKYIVPFFEGTGHFHDDCVDILPRCDRVGGVCAEGMGMTSTGKCTMPLTNWTSYGVRLDWTNAGISANLTATMTNQAPACVAANVENDHHFLGYHLYRSSRPIDIINISQAERLAFIDSHTNTWFDVEGTQFTYYAVVPLFAYGEGILGVYSTVSAETSPPPPPRRRIGGY
jgi:hypothetical protein